MNPAGGRLFKRPAMRGEMSGEAQNSGRKPPPAPSLRRRCCRSPENPGCAPWSGPPTQLKLPARVHMHTCSAATTTYPAPHPRLRRQRAAALPALQLPKVPDLKDEARGIAPAPVQTADHICTDQPPISRCPPLPTAASTPQPAAFPPLIPRNRDSVSSHGNPAAPPPRWYKCTGPSKGKNYRSNKSQTPRRGPVHRVSPSDPLENLAKLAKWSNPKTPF